MRTPIIAANWKMHKRVAEAVEFAAAFTHRGEAFTGVETILCAPFTALYSLGARLAGTNTALGAQDVYWEPKGAFTGEISVEMLTDVGCRYVVIGHSERRALFGETDADVNKKVRAALTGGLRVILCVGETLAQRRSGETAAVVTRQLQGGLNGLELADPADLVVAYEPVWAIGTGENATGDQAQEVCALVRQRLGELFGAEPAQSVRIQYGGSVKPANVAEIMAQPDIDGALVGGASLEVEAFAAICSGARP
ncbi:MAG TPA: triose-phosphate isomerase [Limnochordia bacterium]|nr:triose-phosphate isomerase [Limnochordia bacterium]